MRVLIFFLLCIVSSYNVVEAMRNGDYHPITDHPFMVQVHAFQYGVFMKSMCGGAILSESWIVTAAHCVENLYSVFKVRLGSSLLTEKGKLVRTSAVLVHGGYETSTSDNDNVYNDICLLKLSEPLEFNEYQQPIQIAREPPKINDTINVIGFGNLHHNVGAVSLRSSPVLVAEDRLCTRSLGSRLCTSTKNVNLCSGDSGGPAVFNNKLVGIISMGCNPKMVNLLTNVAHHYDWIVETTGIKYSE